MNTGKNTSEVYKKSLLLSDLHTSRGRSGENPIVHGSAIASIHVLLITFVGSVFKQS